MFKNPLALLALLLAVTSVQAQQAITLRIQPYADGPASALNVARGPLQAAALTLPVLKGVSAFVEAGYADAQSTLFSRGGVEVERTLKGPLLLRLHGSIASGNLSRDFSRQYTLIEGRAEVGYGLRLGRLALEPGFTIRYDGIAFDAAQYSYRAGRQDRGWLGAHVRAAVPISSYLHAEVGSGLLAGTHHAGAIRAFGQTALVVRF